MTTTYPSKPDLIGVGTALDAYQSGWETRDQALLARIAALEAAARPATLFGSSNPESLPLDTRTAAIPVTRAYLSPGQEPTDYRRSSNLKAKVDAATDAVILSWKDVAGSWLDQLLSSLEPTGLRIYGCQNHEPYDNFYPGNVLDFHSRWDRAETVMAGHAHVVPTLILDGYRPESWDAFSRPSVPVWGMDVYNPGIQTPKAYAPPLDLYRRYVEWADANGKRKLIGETGTGLVGSDEKGRRQWSLDAHHALEAYGVEAAAWWFSGKCVTPLDTYLAWLLG